jgi:hypothetical protein
VIVIADGKSKDTVWMRSEIDVPCQNGTVHQALAKAILHYPDAPLDVLPTTAGGHTWESNDCMNVSKYILEALGTSANLGPGSTGLDSTHRCQTRT